jgi:hypothetical protein
MKSLSLEKMENIEGQGWFGEVDFWGGLACGAYVMGSIALIAGTGGAAAPVVMLAGSATCGGYIGVKLFWE